MVFKSLTLAMTPSLPSPLRPPLLLPAHGRSRVAARLRPGRPLRAGQGHVLIEDAMWASRVPVFAIPFMIPTAASCAWEEPPVTVVLECKGSVTKYKNGILFRSDGGPTYYRIELRLSDAVVQFKIGDENYDLPERYDLKTSNSSYRLALPSNTTTYETDYSD